MTKKLNRLAVLVVTMAVSTAFAQAPQTGKTAPAHSWTTEQIITASGRDAWFLGGKTEDGFVQIVEALMEISEQKRGVELPESNEEGLAAGNYIKTHVKEDPDQLLYVIVDQAVQRSAKKNTDAGKGNSNGK
jgi:hypothetical protein